MPRRRNQTSGRRRELPPDALLQRSLDPPAGPLPWVRLKTPTRHPLIYRKRIDETAVETGPGDMVELSCRGADFGGFGLYNPQAEIAVRSLSLDRTAPDRAWWRGRLMQALELRERLLRLGEMTDAWRIVHAEGDGLPGLAVDRFADVLSAECFSLAMYQRAAALLAELAELTGARHTVFRCGPHTQVQEGFAADPLASPNCPERVEIQECGTRFRVDLAGGHKTGFFCDQRENRRRLAENCSGRTVLDLCCYTGGFALQAKRLGGAAEATGVEIDEQPLALARHNANLNQQRIQFVQADAFAYMRDMIRNRRQYDVVVLDPPKLIPNRRAADAGRSKYFDLNRVAMQLVRPGGMLLSCSCSGLLSAEEFRQTLAAAARKAVPQGSDRDESARSPGRELQFLSESGAAADHPVAANCPESAYLKAVWMRVL